MVTIATCPKIHSNHGSMVMTQPKVLSLTQPNNDFKVFKNHVVKGHLIILLSMIWISLANLLNGSQVTDQMKNLKKKVE